MKTQAKDFRIGNLVQIRVKMVLDNSKQKEWRTIELDADGIKNLYIGQSYFEYQPIPLNKEILLSFGFEVESKINVSYRGVRKHCIYLKGNLSYNEYN